jgi:hypothetical protein
MAQQNRKRRRKHRGTQAGTIDRAGRTSKPSASSRSSSSSSKGSGFRAGAQAGKAQSAAERRQARLDTEPTWRGSLNRAGFAAAILVIFVMITQKNIVQAILLGAFAMLLYIPMSYYTDRALYRRRQRQKQRPGR